MKMNEVTSLKISVQRLGSALSNMVMPIIPAFIAWGILTSFVIPDGFMPNTNFANMVGPMLAYLIPLLIGYTAGKNIYEHRGGVVGAIGTMGALVAAQVGPGIPMILGAMVVGPLGGWIIKKFDEMFQIHIKAGLEMLFNNFSAGLIGFFLALVAYVAIEPIVTVFTNLMAQGVDFLLNQHLMPLANILIEPAKILFLNNAVNHGILTPLGIEQASQNGRSILFLLESNPGPGLGVLLAFMFFGKGSAKATTPGAILIHFIGGIHEIYFPYVMMKPILFLAVIIGGVSGTATNSLLGSGLVAPASPGSILAITAQASSPVAGGGLNVIHVWLSVLVGTLASFCIAFVILKRDKSLVDDTQLKKAQKQVQKAKSLVKDEVLPEVVEDLSGINKIIFACDAGMGSSAMGASILRDKVKKAGINIPVSHTAIAHLTDDVNALVVTQQELVNRVDIKAPSSTRIGVDNFLDAPKYDAIIAKFKEVHVSNSFVQSQKETDFDFETIDRIVFAHDKQHQGSATMGKVTLQALLDKAQVKVLVNQSEFTALDIYNNPATVIITMHAFVDEVENYAPKAQHVVVDSFITTQAYGKIVASSKK